MTGFNSKRQAAWNKFAEKWQGIAKWKDPELNPIDTVQPTAWQWLDSGHFRKKIPKHSNPAEWNPLYKSPAAQPAPNIQNYLEKDTKPAQEPVDNDFFKSLAKQNPSPDQRPWVGLTDDDWEPLYDKFAKYQEYGAFVSGWDNFARAIEQLLKEKNT